MDRQINEKLGEFDLLNEPGFKSISGAQRLHLVSTKAEWQIESILVHIPPNQQRYQFSELLNISEMNPYLE
jgi:hypothetical protein